MRALGRRCTDGPDELESLVPSVHVSQFSVATISVHGEGIWRPLRRPPHPLAWGQLLWKRRTLLMGRLAREVSSQGVLQGAENSETSTFYTRRTTRLITSRQICEPLTTSPLRFVRSASAATHFRFENLAAGGKGITHCFLLHSAESSLVRGIKAWAPQRSQSRSHQRWQRRRRCDAARTPALL